MSAFEWCIQCIVTYTAKKIEKNQKSADEWVGPHLGYVKKVPEVSKINVCN